MSSVKLSAVSKTYMRGAESVPAVADMNFEVRRGEFVALLGPSGCGKTTMLRLVAGLELPTEGSVLVDERRVVGPGPDRAVVFQQFALFPWKTVRENIEFGLKCIGASRDERRRGSNHYISLMHLTGHENAYPYQLSGGMQQRVAIARSYALKSDVLLMDEPFAALDSQTRQMMQEELIKIVQVEPRTVIFVTHSVEEALYLADRVVVLSRRPARILASIDIVPIRQREHWNSQFSAAVQANSAFNDLRVSIWSMLREEILGEKTRKETIRRQDVPSNVVRLGQPGTVGQLEPVGDKEELR